MPPLFLWSPSPYLTWEAEIVGEEKLIMGQEYRAASFLWANMYLSSNVILFFVVLGFFVHLC